MQSFYKLTYYHFLVLLGDEAYSLKVIGIITANWGFSISAQKLNQTKLIEF
jgi:hypothetical protein